MRAIDLKRPPPLATVVAERVREAILYGDLKLGEAVSEEKLAASLGVSRTPVREALTTLSLQGLIDIRPQRGSFVFTPAAEDVATLCEYRAIIEVQAMRLSHARDRDGTLAMMQDAERAQDLAETAGARVDAARADDAFHNAFIAHCGNSLLQQAYRLASGRVGAIRFHARGSSDSRARSNRDHRAILETFAAADLTTCEGVLTAHIMRMREHFEAAAG